MGELGQGTTLFIWKWKDSSFHSSLVFICLYGVLLTFRIFLKFSYFQFIVAKPANPRCELNILPNQSFRKLAKYVSWFRKRNVEVHEMISWLQNIILWWEKSVTLNKLVWNSVTYAIGTPKNGHLSCNILYLFHQLMEFTISSGYASDPSSKVLQGQHHDQNSYFCMSEFHASISWEQEMAE